MAITRHDILALTKRRFKDVHIPGVGTFRIASLRNSEMRKIRQSLLTRDGELDTVKAAKLQDLLVASCLVDGDGNRLFSDDEALAGCFDELDGAVTAGLFAECKSWTGFGKDPDWQAIEDASKNSVSTS